MKEQEREQVSLKIRQLEHDIRIKTSILLENRKEDLVEAQEKVTLSKGLVYGLLFGIFGNLFVQSLYAVINSLFGVGLIGMFFVNVALFVVSVFVILFVAFYFRKSMRTEQTRALSLSEYLRSGKEDIEKDYIELDRWKERLRSM